MEIYKNVTLHPGQLFFFFFASYQIDLFVSIQFFTFLLSILNFLRDVFNIL